MLAQGAAALEPGSIAGEPVTLDVTESTSVIHALDNRDFRQNQVPTLANDHFGMWYNRLNLQASSGRWQLGLRLDNAWFYTSPDPTEIALELERERRRASGGGPDPAYFRGKVVESGIELSNRYINWLYPAKYYASYGDRNLELMLGDSYAEFGRGFVLSVRKQDELASDTTVRGVRGTARINSGELRLKLSGLFGSLNPLRIDEASGRYLGTDDSVRPGLLALTEAGMPHAVETDFVKDGGDCTLFATCSYAPDRLVAGQLEARAEGLTLATQASLLSRQSALSSDVVRSARRVLTASQSLELPRATRELSLYFEAALQKLDPGNGSSAIDAGHALYGSLSFAGQPLHLALQGKHYRRFFPLLANVSTARAREFALLAYSAPPTTEPLEADTLFENFNTCTSGARLSADADLSDQLTLLTSLAHYRTWAESAPNEACVIDERFENRIFDGGAGFELDSADRRAHGRLLVGGRIDHSAEPLPTPRGESTLYYYEVNARYELGYPLAEALGLEITGVHRRRYQLVGGPAQPWFQGYHITSLNIAERWSVGAGVEYDTSNLVPPTYFNGEVRFRPTPASSLSLFVGQRAGTLRCIGGVCRVFPPFEGARLDAVLRF